MNDSALNGADRTEMPRQNRIAMMKYSEFGRIVQLFAFSDNA
jgi:hypothetical protein